MKLKNTKTLLFIGSKVLKSLHLKSKVEMRRVLALIFLFSVFFTFVEAQNDEIKTSYQEWMTKFKKTGLKGTQNVTQAEKTFNANAARIAKHNSNKKATYEQALNANADMTASEIKKKRKGLIPEVLNKTVDKTLSSKGNSVANQLTQSLSSSKVSATDSNLKSKAPKSLNMTA